MSKRLRNALLGAAACLVLATPVLAATHAPSPGQAALDAFAHHLGYSFAVLDNKSPDGMVAEIDLTTPKTVPAAGWSVYFGMVMPIKGIDSDSFDITHINGDLFRLTPKPGVTILAGKTYPITIHGEGDFFSEYHATPNAYVAADGLTARTIDASRPAIDTATGQEYLPFHKPMTDEAKQGSSDANIWLTPERLFDQTAQRTASVPAADIIILPTPQSATRLTGTPLNLRTGIKVTVTGAAMGDIQTALNTLKATVGHVDRGVPVHIDITGQGAPESYHLLAAKGVVTITAADAAGAAYALESLAQQAAFEHGVLKPIEITDAPRFGFRGLHLDLARNFESKAHILAIIDTMEAYKLNRLHLHLGDDEGWRLAIADLPELTDIGSKRCHDLAEDHCLLPQLGAGPDGTSSVNGFLTRADYIDILKAAKAHHIEVIPSFDMPGHSRAAVRSMEARARRLIAAGQPEAAAEYRLQDPADTTVYDSIQHYDDNTLNICLPSTYHFIEKVIDSIKAMHDEAGLPLKIYHIGTDETAGAWTGSPACQKLMNDQHLTIAQVGTSFITQVSQMLDRKGIEPAGWSDGMGSADPAQMPKVVQSNSWGGLFTGGVAAAYTQANYGWDIVMSTPETLYFDMPYAPDPKERGYDWASRNTDLFKVFSFMPENLPANASIMKNHDGYGQTIADTVPLTGKGHITGMQGQLWSEGVRSDRIADYLLFPRVQALAERAWHTGDWEPAYKAGQSYSYGDRQVDAAKLLADWQVFNTHLNPQLAALDARGLTYRLPVPGARITGGILEANVPYGDLAIQYRTKGGKWTRYSGPVGVKGTVELRTLSPNAKRVSRTVSVS